MQAQKQIAQAMHASSEGSWFQLDLTMSQFKGLMHLAEMPMTIGQLAGALGVGKPAASILVDRLVQLDLVERTEDPLDRRRTIARLTGQGDDIVTRLRQGSRDRLRGWMAQLSDDDLAALVQGLSALAGAAQTATVPARIPA